MKTNSVESVLENNASLEFDRAWDLNLDLQKEQKTTKYRSDEDTDQEESKSNNVPKIDQLLYEWAKV